MFEWGATILHDNSKTKTGEDSQQELDPDTPNHCGQEELKEDAHKTKDTGGEDKPGKQRKHSAQENTEKDKIETEIVSISAEEKAQEQCKQEDQALEEKRPELEPKPQPQPEPCLPSPSKINDATQEARKRSRTPSATSLLSSLHGNFSSSIDST